MPAPDRKTREFARRGQDILDAALALFGSEDWEDVTVDEIARQAEVAKGTIYKHFASKDEIYARLAIGFQQRILERLGDIDAALPVPERFARFVRCAWEVHLSSRELHRVFLYCSRAEFHARLPQALVDELVAADVAALQPLHELIAQGIAQGLFPPRPAELLLFGTRATFWGAIQLVWSGYLGDIDHDAWRDELIGYMLAGLSRHDGPGAAAASNKERFGT